MRAVARDWSVAVVQFLKSGEWQVGEEAIARRLGVDWWAFGDGFTWDSDDLDRGRAVAEEAWTQAKALIQPGEYRLVVLDEITYPVNYGWIEADDVVATIRDRPPQRSTCSHRPRRARGADRPRRHRHRDAQGQARLRDRRPGQARDRLLVMDTLEDLLGDHGDRQVPPGAVDLAVNVLGAAARLADA